MTFETIQEQADKALQSYKNLESKIKTNENKQERITFFAELSKLATLIHSFNLEPEKKIETVENHELKSYELLFKSGIILNSTLDEEEMLNLAMDTVVEMSHAKRAYLALLDDNLNTTLSVARNADKKNLEESSLTISRQVIERTLAMKDDAYVRSKESEKSIIEKSSIMTLGKLSVICVPIVLESKIKAVLYLDEFDQEVDFQTFSLIKSFSYQLSTILKQCNRYKQLREKHTEIINQLRGRFRFENIIGRSESMVQVLKTVSKVSATVANVLLQGPSGTGKDLIARAIHQNSERVDKPYVEIDCGALPSTLIESELFGHKKGAFTGAQNDKIGLLEAAQGGTLFMDEINNMPADTQMRLLRALQNRRIRRIGDTHEIEVDFRLIVASSKDLFQSVKDGQFREDLYYRINTISIILPPLKDRNEDILELILFFIEKYSKLYQKKINKIHPAFIKHCEAYNWPGNVRELEHVIERSIILSEDNELHIRDLPESISGLVLYEPAELHLPIENVNMSLDDFINQSKMKYIEKILIELNGKKSEAAKKLGIDRSYLFTLIKKYNLPY